MENDPLFSSPPGNGDDSNPGETGSQDVSIYPPKPELENKKGNVWIRSISSLVLYILIGYYFFSANWILLLILTGIVVFHELGHFFAMKMYHYTELGIFFIPLLGAYASGTKREVSQRQSAVILLAGPMPGIVLGVALYFIATSRITDLSYENAGLLVNTSTLLIFLNVLNLLPIYPLDGGQLLNRLFLDDTNIIGRIFVIISALALGLFAIRLGMGNSFFYVLLIFPLTMIMRMFSDNKHDRLVKAVEQNNINLEKTYDEISDEEYWKIRNVLIENNYPTLRHVNPAPPYEYSSSEDKVVSAIENILQRTVIQDLSVVEKTIIILVWIGSFAVPFLLNMDLPLSHYQTR